MALGLEVAGEVRELGEGEGEILPPVRAPVVKRLRESHHALARALALGLTPMQASAQTGYSPSRISLMQNDPSFQELITFYRADKERVARDMEAHFLGIGLDALQELHERLQDAPTSMSDPFLLEFLKTMLDRAGYSPIARSVNRNVNVNIGDRLDAARRRLKEDDAA